MMIKALALCALAASANIVSAYEWGNPVVTKPAAGEKIKAGDKVVVEWGESKVGSLNVEIYCPRENASSFPVFLGTVNAAAKKFEWKVPESFVGSDKCRFLVWGAVQPGGDGTSNGASGVFEIENSSEKAVALFTVFTPVANKELDPKEGSVGGCYWGKECKITWGYDDLDLQRPDTVNIAVYTPESPFQLFTIAQSVPAAQREYSWEVPQRDSELGALLAKHNVYISVSGAGVPLSHENEQSHMGATSMAFKIDDYVAPKPEEPAVQKLDSADIDSGKLKKLSTNGAASAAAGSALALAAVAAVALL